MSKTFPQNAKRKAQSAERKKNKFDDFLLPLLIATQQIFRSPKPSIRMEYSICYHTPCALLSNLQGGQRQQGKKTSNNP